MLWTVPLISSLIASTAWALDCSSDKFAPYRLKDSFTQVSSKSIITDTPPSKTNTTWYLNLCNQQEQIIEDCPKNSQICGIQTVLLPGETPIKTQIVSFGNGLNYNVLEANKSDIYVKLDDSSWGSNSITAQLELHCAESEDIQIDWDYTNFVLRYATPAACLKDDKSAPPPGSPKDGEDDKKKDDSWGWFTWLFIVLVLIFGGYIIFGAWITASKSPADFQDAVHDFVETLGNLVKSLPGFLKEIGQKIFGSENRGGYSAV